eukprot:3101135-Prymnesium_polylepis.1
MGDDGRHVGRARHGEDGSIHDTKRGGDSHSHDVHGADDAPAPGLRCHKHEHEAVDHHHAACKGQTIEYRKSKYAAD